LYPWDDPKLSLELRFGLYTFDPPGPATHEVRKVLSAVIQPEYTLSDPHNDDIALLRLDRPLPDRFTPVTLARSMDLDAETMLTLLGWGATEIKGQEYRSDQLRIVRLPLVDPTVPDAPETAECKSYNDKFVPGKGFCAGYWDKGDPDAGKGDSGGPLFLEKDSLGPGQPATHTQYGLVSGSDLPTVFTSIPYWLDWISTNLQRLAADAYAVPEQAALFLPNYLSSYLEVTVGSCNNARAFLFGLEYAPLSPMVDKVCPPLGITTVSTTLLPIAGGYNFIITRTGKKKYTGDQRILVARSSSLTRVLVLQTCCTSS